MARRRAGTGASDSVIKVEIGPLFGEPRTVTVPKDSTVKDVLTGAGYGENVEVRIDGEGTVEKDAIVEDGDILTVVSSGKVEAGLR